MTEQVSAKIGQPVTIEAGQYAGCCGVVDGMSASGKTLDVFVNERDMNVYILLSSVELYD